MRLALSIATVIGIGVGLGAPPRAHAWNPLKAAAEKLRSAGHAVGGVLGAPAGGFVEAAAAPTIHTAEDAGHRLIDDLDLTLSSNIERAHIAIGSLLDQATTGVGVHVATVNTNLQARILQIQTGLDKNIDHAFDRLDLAIGRLDHDANRLVDRAQVLIEQLDSKVAANIASIDKVLASRVSDLRALVISSVEQADRMAKARIDQLDEVTAKRVGNLDVVATKQSLNLEGMLVRIAALVGLVGLIAFVAWRLFREAADALSYATTRNMSRARALGTRATLRLVPQLVLAGGGALLLLYLADQLPRDSVRRAQQQIAREHAAFADSVRAFDLVSARYHQSQLEILAPEDSSSRAELQKLEVLHSVFTRPGQLASPDGLAVLVASVAQVDAVYPRGDPEIAIAKAYILWQVGGTRDDEYEAATLCATALERAPDSPLATLARNYIIAFLHDPYTPPRGGTSIAQLRKALAAQVPDDVRFAHVIDLDKLIAQLDRASTTAYLDMLSAQADLEAEIVKTKRPPKVDTQEIAAARAARTKAAQRVVDVWAAFDRVLEESPAIANDALVLAAFTLDDSVLSHARFYVELGATNDRPPLLTASKLSALQRTKIAPIRVAWEQRYAPLLGPREREILAYEESLRFKTFEQRSTGFEASYLDFVVAMRTNARSDILVARAGDAAKRAAGMGLYRDLPGGARVAEAARIADQVREATGASLPDDVLADVNAAYRMRRLRFL